MLVSRTCGINKEIFYEFPGEGLPVKILHRENMYEIALEKQPA